MIQSYPNPAAIKVGVIGYGGAFNMGQKHLNEMKQCGMVPTAVTELISERLQVAESDFPGIETYPTVELMLEKSKVDLVTIITPHNTHAPLGLQCLEAGRHVVLEKPMAITTEECDQLIETAQKHNLLLSTYHNRHWDGCALEAVRQIREEKLIGEIYGVRASWFSWNPTNPWWRNSKSISGGILYDWGVHLLEYILQVVEGDIQEVTGFAKSGLFEKISPWKADAIEAEAKAVVRLSSGAWIELMVTALDHQPVDSGVTFFGTAGTYRMTLDQWVLSRKVDGETRIRQGRNPKAEGHRFYENVTAALTGQAPLIITGEWARRPIQIIDLAGKSARQGKTLKALYP